MLGGFLLRLQGKVLVGEPLIGFALNDGFDLSTKAFCGFCWAM
jgi:hypothetical protein